MAHDILRQTYANNERQIPSNIIVYIITFPRDREREREIRHSLVTIDILTLSLILIIENRLYLIALAS